MSCHQYQLSPTSVQYRSSRGSSLAQTLGHKSNRVIVRIVTVIILQMIMGSDDLI